MQITPEQAQFLAGLSIHNAEEEFKITRKVLAAVPADKGDYAPHPTNMNAMKLCWHIASAEMWFLESIAAGAFSMTGGEMPESLKTPSDVVGWYEENVPKSMAKVKALAAGQLAAPIDFLGIVKLPAAMYFGLMQMHSAHHRGQLSTYLRPMGGKVPSIYGGSADEPFQMPASASA